MYAVWSRAVMLEWPTQARCEEPRRASTDLVRSVARLQPDDPQLLTVRHLALQCELHDVLAAFVQDVAMDWASLASYRSHCHASGSATDARCLVLVAVEGVCRDPERAGDVRCDALAPLVAGQDGLVNVTTNASVRSPSSSTSTWTSSPTSTHAASNSGR